ncbi:MAG TPA: hypothetical protein VHS96_18630, partial [Bacteroidia bacterium]|nr:hypothetical protein [Bacteroidia bacterium]
YGFPFTALFTLPQVYGSSLIAPRLDHLGIYNEFIPFPGEGHNVWGTVVSNNFVGGPTQYWDPILVDIEEFLWHFLKPETGPITGIGYSYPNAIETYSVPAQPGFHWCWTVNGGTIVSANPNSNSIDIQWQTLGLRTITARAFSQLDAAGDTSLLQVVVGPSGAGDMLACGRECGLSAFQKGDILRVDALGLPTGAYELSLCDLQGRVLVRESGKSAGELHAQFPVNGLPSGLLLLTLEMKGLRQVEKVMIFAE